MSLPESHWVAWPNTMASGGNLPVSAFGYTLETVLRFIWLPIAVLLTACSLETGALLPRSDAAGPADSGGDGGDTGVRGPDACVPRAESCNAADDDCDGMIDEGFDIMADPENCGRCGTSCGVDPANAAAMCTMGVCGLDCDAGFDDCDGDRSNGCEASTTEPARCGSCTTACGVTRSLCQTLGGSSTCVATCATGTTLCGETRCVNTEDDPANCGDCDMACSAPMNAEPACVERACAVSCDAGFDDCDGVLGNGCEAPLDSPADCGACGVDCSRDHAVAGCGAGECNFACEIGFGDCDGMEANGCEMAVDTLTDCGACGVACEAPNGTPECSTSSCLVDSCDPGFNDCNGSATDGCESRPDEDEDNCGACGTSCAGVCNGGLCHIDCFAGPCNDGCNPSTADCGCAGGAHCGYLCSDSRDCLITCEQRNTQCTVLGSSPAVFTGLCKSGADCDFRMQSGETITVECKDRNTSCDVDCRGATNCTVNCHADAKCRLRCDVPSATCQYSTCGGGDATCTDGSIVCNRACPP
ncbi:MAG: hypothetical protein DRJ42_00375 [Deltaproteobacteria bacterium]|nr:MAG: hypothetical protein DRJ42_00375 [Deltaproteobacteria bacterium]